MSPTACRRIFSRTGLKEFVLPRTQPPFQFSHMKTCPLGTSGRPSLYSCHADFWEKSAIEKSKKRGASGTIFLSFSFFFK